MLERLDVLEGGRKELRRGVRLACDVVSEYWDDALPFDLVDLSPSGAFVESQLPLGNGEEIELRFTPPRSKALYWFRGRVVRSSLGRRCKKNDVPGMGIEFLDLTRTDRSALAGYLVGIPPRVPLRKKNGVDRPNRAVSVRANEMIWVEELLVDELENQTFDFSAATKRDVDEWASFNPRAIAPLLSAGIARNF